MTSIPDVAALMATAAEEPEAIDDLERCVKRLRHVQGAKRALAQVPPDTLRAVILQRASERNAQS